MNSDSIVFHGDLQGLAVHNLVALMSYECQGMALK